MLTAADSFAFSREQPDAMGLTTASSTTPTCTPDLQPPPGTSRLYAHATQQLLNGHPLCHCASPHPLPALLAGPWPSLRVPAVGQAQQADSSLSVLTRCQATVSSIPAPLSGPPRHGPVLPTPQLVPQPPPPPQCLLAGGRLLGKNLETGQVSPSPELRAAQRRSAPRCRPMPTPMQPWGNRP